MEDFELTKKLDMGIFDRRFNAIFDDPIYDPTKMTIIQGTDGVLDDLFSYQVYNKLKNHWRLDVEPADKQVGMIWSESGGNDKLFHYGEVGGDAWEEVLQVTRSSDKSPYFANLYLAEFIYHTGDLDTYIKLDTDRVTLRAGAKIFVDMAIAGVDYLRLHTGMNFIGGTANTKMTIGLTIEQADNDDEILALKSSDVAHGVTDHAETDTFGHFEKQSGAVGGVRFRGFTEDVIGMNIEGIATNDDTDKDTGANAPIQLVARKKSGTAYGVVGADANLVVMRNNTLTRWILDEDGDTWQDGIVTTHGLIVRTPIELTIAGGMITVTKSYHTVDTQGNDATDDLDTINGGVDGYILIIRPIHTDRTINVVEGGNIRLDGGNRLMINYWQTLTLIYDATLSLWLEMAYGQND